MHAPEETKVVFISAPKSYASTAATTEYINMGLYRDVDFIIPTGAWAGGTAAVTAKQAINASGSSSAALAISEYWTNKSSTSVDTLTKTSVSSSTFNLATASAMHVIHFDAAKLTDGKDYVALAIASPGANADYYSIAAILSNPRYVSDNPPSAIT